MSENVKYELIDEQVLSQQNNQLTTEIQPSEEVIELQEIASEPSPSPEIVQKFWDTSSFGLLLMAFSAFFFSLMSLTAKALAGKLPLFWIIGGRGIVKVTICLICCAFLRLNPFGPRDKWPYLILRGAMGTGNVITYYFAIGNLMLSEAVVLSFTNPVFTAIFAVIFLKEKMHRFDIIGVFVNVIGVIFVARPAFLFGNLGELSLWRLANTGIALASALFAGAAYVTIRKMGTGVHFVVIVFYFGMSVLLVSIPFAIAFRPTEIPEWQIILLVIGNGIASFLGQICLSRGLQLEKATKATAMNYLQIVFAFIWEMAIFHSGFQYWSFLGAAMICGWAALTAWRKHRQQKEKDLQNATVMTK